MEANLITLSNGSWKGDACLNRLLYDLYNTLLYLFGLPNSVTILAPSQAKGKFFNRSARKLLYDEEGITCSAS
jgi:hypothetical protein